MNLFRILSIGLGTLVACGREPAMPRSLIAFSIQKGLDSEIMVVAPDGSDPRTIAPSDAVEETPAWAPDGMGLLFMSERGALKSGIYLWDGELRLLCGAHTWFERAPNWSPDGRRIAFMSNRDHNWEIYTVDADGSDAVRLTKDPAWDEWPVWTRDGKSLLFSSNRGGQYDLYRMKLEGKEKPQPLTNDRGWDGRPAISPDGKRIVWPSEREGQLAYYLMNLDGTESRRLTSFEARSEDDWMPGASWAPNGRRIVFVSNRDGFKELYTIAPDGSNERRLTTLRSVISCPVWSPELPPNLSWTISE